MKYMLLLNVPGGPYQHTSWPEQDWRAHVAFMRRFADKLTELGEYVGGAALTAPDQAKRVRAGQDGRPITDGVFPEAKEFLAGYWLVDVETPERACEIAAGLSAAPGLGGVPLNMPIEVRQVMRAPIDDPLACP
jgi:hypothetical protein